MRKDNYDFMLMLSRILLISSILFALSVILSQVFSIVNEKTFWDDEWSILINIKFRAYADLFENLIGNQQFPKVYLTIIKYFSDNFNYNYLSLRMIPFTIQTINVLFAFYIRKKIFEDSIQKSYVIFLLFLSFPTSLLYYSQLKQYTMDMFMSVLAIWQFLELNSFYRKKEKLNWAYFTIIIIFLLGPFFSYSYAIVASPMILFLIITILLKFEFFKLPLKILAPIIVFIFSCGFAFIIDIRLVLSNRYMSTVWSEYFVNYSNIRDFFDSLYNIYLFLSLHMSADPIKYSFFIGRLIICLKVIITFLVLIGTITSFKTVCSKDCYNFSRILRNLSFIKKIKIETYFLTLFIVILFLFFFKMLPLGIHRLNCFSVFMLSFFIVEGISTLLKQKAKFPLFIGYATMPFLIATIIIPIIYWNIHEIKMDRYGDQKQYTNISKAIELSNKKNLSIFLVGNRKSEELVKLNPKYLKEKPIRIYIITSETQAKITMLANNLDEGVLLQKYTHKKLHMRKLDDQNVMSK